MKEGGGGITIFILLFLYNITETFRKGILWRFIIFRYRKKVGITEGRGSRFSVEFVLSHSTKTFRRGTLLCIVSETFRLRKSLWIRGGGEGGGIEVLRRNFFVLTVPKIS